MLLGGSPEAGKVSTDQLAVRYASIDSFVAQTRVAVFVRAVDRLLLIRPDRTLGLNETAVAILGSLYDVRAPRPAAETCAAVAKRFAVAPLQVLEDAERLIENLRRMLNQDFSPREGLRFLPFNRAAIAYPTIAEIALTYACNAACRFCYAAAGPQRSRRVKPMGTDEVRRVMRRIFEEAHVPSLSFTGGEATLRRDLPELIAFGKQLGFRINLISNGLRLAEPDYARELVDAGLDSAQLSLEAGRDALHDAIVGRSGAFAQTVQGVKNLQQLGTHVHTNTTLCVENLDDAGELLRFVARDLRQELLSMNMLIPTGEALQAGEPRVSYRQIGERLPALLAEAKREGIKLVWYSPLPYCLFNPVWSDLGAKACACVDGILSVAPDGQVLPCSSFEQGIGSLLERPFEKIYRSKAARYWRDKRYVPPGCRACGDVDLCGGACPLYWDAAGSFDELPEKATGDRRARRRWQRRRARGGSFGVAAPEPKRGCVWED